MCDRYSGFSRPLSVSMETLAFRVIRSISRQTELALPFASSVLPQRQLVDFARRVLKKFRDAPGHLDSREGDRVRKYRRPKRDRSRNPSTLTLFVSFCLLLAPLRSSRDVTRVLQFIVRHISIVLHRMQNEFQPLDCIHDISCTVRAREARKPLNLRRKGTG